MRTFEGHKGSFLSIIQLLAKYDTVFDKLLQLPKGSPKYLSPLIQDELISVLAEEVLLDILFAHGVYNCIHRIH